MRTKHESPWEMATEAALHYADASADDPREFARAKDRARKAWLRWAAQAFLGRDTEVRIVVTVKRPKPTPAGQVSLWPARMH